MSNSIIESSHKIIGQVIRTLLLQYSPTTLDDANVILDEAVATAMHALRCTPNTSLSNFSLGSLVFQRDMFLDLPLITNIVQLTRHHQAQIDQRLLCINARRVSHDYAVGEKVYYRNFDRDKLEAVRFGPFEFSVFILITLLLSAEALLKNVFPFVILLRFDCLKITLCGRMNTPVWLVLPSGFPGDSS